LYLWTPILRTSTVIHRTRFSRYLRAIIHCASRRSTVMDESQ
jgi:hypothetical protein